MRGFKIPEEADDAKRAVPFQCKGPKLGAGRVAADCDLEEARRARALDACGPSKCQIREAALEGVRDELPHSLAVVIDDVSPREGRDDLIDVHAILFVERGSQKGIVIGKGGARLREVGTAARTQIEKLLGTKVYLELRVKIAKNWQRDPKQLGRLGF